MAGVYQVTTTALTPLGVSTPASFTFQVTIIDPCIAAVFTIDSSVFPQPVYEYVASLPADTQTALDAKVSSSEVMATCPDIIFSLTNADLSAIDSTVFTFDPIAQTLVTFSNDPTKIGSYPMRLAAQYNGPPTYSEAGSHLFTVDVIDPCLNHAVLTPQGQLDPPSYLYTGDAVTFTLTPFVIDPVGFCTPTYQCTETGGSRLDLCSFSDGITSATFNSVTGNYVF